MKRFLTLCAAALLLTGCSASGSSAPESKTEIPAELTVEPDEGFDEAYANCLRDYFAAIGNADYDAYKKTVYPAYLDCYAKYLATENETPESAFDALCHRFDEDGYESWRLTTLTVGDCANADIDGFFETYQKWGFVDEAFVTATKAEAQEIKHVQFSLYALYAGDEEPVCVARAAETVMLKTADGVYVIG